jgi:3-hydroxyisobutyrate dehydrogenase-like beta-hydroxyacid dehydrogenase
LPAGGFARNLIAREFPLRSAQRRMSHPARKIIGVIGLGIIGRGVTTNLRRKGFQVFVWNRTPRPVPNFVGSPTELVEMCDYIQIFVSDDDALLQAVQQFSGRLTPRHVIIAHSTVAPNSMRTAAEIVERRGARFVEAPFTGSKVAAEKGELVYYVAGTDAALREVRPILEASAKEIIEIGEVGQATAIKIATNMVTAASVQAAAEALGIVGALGLPLEKFVRAMKGNASHSAALAMKMPKMIERNFEPHFSVRNMLKDMQIANHLGSSHYLELRVTAAARDQLLEQMQWGYGDEDYSAIARKYLPDSGLATPEEPGTGDQNMEAQTGELLLTLEPTAAVADVEGPKPQQENRNAATEEAMTLAFPAKKAEEETQSRHGFLNRLLRRGKQLLKQTSPSKGA